MSYQAPFQLALSLDASAPPPSSLAPASPSEGRIPPEGLEERARQLAWALSRDLHLPVRLTVTDNRTTMLSFQRSGAGLRVRLHHMFLNAPAAVVESLVIYLQSGSARAGRAIDDFIRGHQERIRTARTEDSPELHARGRHVDLQAVFDECNVRYFDGTIRAQIGWGRMPARRRRRSIRLGVYDHQLREIRIHPTLDNAVVPRFFVEFIVFHEMLHQVFPSTAPDREGGGRRIHHPRVFRERERTFPRYREALDWEKQNLGQLLRR